MKKKVTAPLSYDPGKGRPKEHLAYLNWQEMQQLQRLNGGNMEFGPRGLPSFPPADAKGSSSKASSSSSRSSGGGGRDSGQAAARSSSSSKSSGSSYGGGGRDSGSKGGGGGAAPKGGVSGGGGGGGGARDSGAKGNVGMGKAPSAAKAPSYGGGGRDTGRAAPKPSSAAKPAAAPSGVRSIPTVSRVPGVRTPSESQISGAIARSASPAGFVPATPVSLTSQYGTGYYSRFTPVPNETPQLVGRFDPKIYKTEMVNEAGVPVMSWSNKFDPNKLTEGAKKIYQSIEDAAFRTGTPVEAFSGKRNSGSPQHDKGQAVDIRLRDPSTGMYVGEAELRQKYGAAKANELARNPIASVAAGRTKQIAADVEKALGPTYRQFAQNVVGGFMENPGVYGDFKNQRWGGSFQTGKTAKDYMHFDEGKAMTGVSADQAKLRREAANLVAQRPTKYALGSDQFGAPVSVASITQPASVVPASGGAPASGFSRMSPAAQLALQGAVAAGKVLGSPSDYKIPSIKEASAFTKNMVPDSVKIGYMQGEAERFGRKIPSYVASGVSSIGRGIAGAISDRGSVQQASYEAPSEYSDAQFQPYGMTYEQQQKYQETEDRKNKFMKGAAPVAGIASPVPLVGLGLNLANKAIDKAAEAKINKYVASSPAERAEQERKDPSLIGWARVIGVQPQNDYSVYQSWAEERGLRGPGESRGGQQGDQGDIRYAGGVGALPTATTPIDTSTTPPPTSGRRPYQYYQWDVGVNIPSPGDPNYTSYQEYLSKRTQPYQV